MQQSSIRLAARGQDVGVYYGGSIPAVRIAAENFCRDLFRVCGCRAALTRDAQRAAFLIGVFGEDAVTDALAGEDCFTLSAVKSGLRIDRIYLTRGKELPPDDGAFSASPRRPS